MPSDAKRAASESAADLRYDTIGTTVRTPLGDFQIGGSGGRGDEARESGIHEKAGFPDDGLSSGLSDQIHDLWNLSRSQKEIHFR